MIKSLTFLVAISHSSTGNHILSKAVLAVCLAAGQRNSKTFIYHIMKIKRLLFVCSPLLSWDREQVTSYLWSCPYHWLHLVLSFVAWALLLYGSFLLPFVPRFFTVVSNTFTVIRQVLDNPFHEVHSSQNWYCWKVSLGRHISFCEQQDIKRITVS